MFHHIIALSALLGALLPSAALAQGDQLCFAETNQCISGRIREFWEQNGGLPVFGLPIGPQELQTIEGQQLQVQWFERNRLELHPENPAPYDVLLGRLGADRLLQQGRDAGTFTPDVAREACRFFAATQQNVCGPIWTAWSTNGLESGEAGISEAESLALWGLPLSPLITETLSDGNAYQVQYFERARFELHPQNSPPYDVLFGLLGNELRPNSQPAPTAGPEPAQPAPEPAEQQLSGVGPQVTQPFTLSASMAVFTMTHRGDRNFVVQLLDGESKTVAYLANELGSFNGTTSVRVEAAGQYVLKIEADGPWTVAYAQPGGATSGTGLPTRQLNDRQRDNRPL
jgi:hypothetical protein